MNKITVILDDGPKRTGVHNDSNNNDSEVAWISRIKSDENDEQRCYESWIPQEYVASQLREDILAYWRLNSNKYELVDSFNHIIEDDTRLDDLGTTNFVLKRKPKQPKGLQGTSNNIAPSNKRQNEDPFWIQENLYDLFLVHSLPNWNGKGAMWITCYQFKQLILKATSALSRSKDTAMQDKSNNKSVSRRPNTLSTDLTVRVVLAFKTATPKYNGARATFNEFLDALFDVAGFLFPPRTARSNTNNEGIVLSKEEALERLAIEHLIPYYRKLEMNSVNANRTWAELDEIVARKKVQVILQRFTQPLSEIAAAYSTSVSGPRSQRRLYFNEFTKLVHDITPNSMPLTSTELCMVFIHGCRIDLGQQFSSTGMGESAKPVSRESKGATVTSSFITKNLTDGGVIEITCAQFGQLLAYLALIVVPKVYDSHGHNNKPNSKPQLEVLKTKSVVYTSSKLAVQSLKAMLHHISMRLKTTECQSNSLAVVAAAQTRFAGMKKNTTLSLVSLTFLQEFQRMHREDQFTDYLSSCATIAQCKSFDETRTATVAYNKDPTFSAPETQEDEAGASDTPHREEMQEKDVFDIEIKWEDDDITSAAKVVSISPVTSTTSSPERNQGDFDEDKTSTVEKQQQVQFEELERILNDADEIYSFLASEFNRHAVEGRLGDTSIVPQLLEIWVSAGQKYSEVINYLEARQRDSEKAHEKDYGENGEDEQMMLQNHRLLCLERFGVSLYVFAKQLLKSTTKVFQYEQVFHVTNARVYDNNVISPFWDDNSSATFTLELSLETLSLASSKLSIANSGLEQLMQHGQIDILENNEMPSLHERLFLARMYRAHCLCLHGDVLAHNKPCIVDYELGYILEDESDGEGVATRDPAIYTSDFAFTKSTPPSHLYREALQLYRFLRATEQEDTFVGVRWIPTLYECMSKTSFKLATHLPRGCVASKKLLEEAITQLDSTGTGSHTPLAMLREYLSSILVVRQKVFLPETQTSLRDSNTVRNPIKNVRHGHNIGEVITPFYRFVLAAAFREIDTEHTGVLVQNQLSQLNMICGNRGPVSESVVAWLVSNFDSHIETCGLTEKGTIQYFCWLAEADPITFCEILDILTAKYTETQQVSITSSRDTDFQGNLKKATSLRTSHFSQRRHSTLGTMTPTNSSTMNAATESNVRIANSVVVITGTMSKETCGDLTKTHAPSDVRLEPHVVDCLPSNARIPDELSKFCFPDDIFLYTDPLPPTTFDIVLTDISGDRYYGSCFLFTEEKDQIDVLSLISSVQRSSTTATLPSWISLKDIQQRQSKWKFYVPTCLCILSTLPLFETMRQTLSQMYRLTFSRAVLPVESFVFHVLEHVTVPTKPQTSTSFSLIDRFRLLTSHPHVPTISPLLHTSEVDFTLLFQCLSAENIVKVYGFLLTERKIVVTSANASMLTPVAETLRALLHPFECQVVYIPVLPMALLDFVTAPVPFFMGVRSDKRLDRLSAEGVIVVDLDRDEIHLPCVEGLPSLPESKAKKLTCSLRKASTWAVNQKTRAEFGKFYASDLTEITSFFQPPEESENDVQNQLRYHEELLEKWSEIQLVFTTFSMRLLRDYRKHCHKTTSNDGREIVTFDKRGYLAMHPTQREFCTHLFQTQLFQRFMERNGTLSDSLLQLAVSDSEPSWRNVRNKSIISRRSDCGNEDAPKPAVSIIRVPLPPMINGAEVSNTPSPRQRASTRNRREVFAPFDGQLYDEFVSARDKSKTLPTTCQLAITSSEPTIKITPLQNRHQSEVRQKSPIGSPSQSSTAKIIGGARVSMVASKMIMAARLRLDSTASTNSTED